MRRRLSTTHCPSHAIINESPERDKAVSLCCDSTLDILLSALGKFERVPFDGFESVIGFPPDDKGFILPCSLSFSLDRGRHSTLYRGFSCDRNILR